MAAFRTPPGSEERALREGALDAMESVDGCAARDAVGGASDTALDMDFMGACEALFDAGTCTKGMGRGRIGRYRGGECERDG